MLLDPLGPDPIMVIGSANFSVASTTGQRREHDRHPRQTTGSPTYTSPSSTGCSITTTFRSVTEARQDHRDDDAASLFLDETDGWQQKYAPGKLKRKRLDVFAAVFIPPTQ